MEALDGLAVAARDIRALSTARADRARAGDSAHCVRREPASPFQSARGDICGVGHRAFHVETASVTYISLAD